MRLLILRGGIALIGLAAVWLFAGRWCSSLIDRVYTVPLAVLPASPVGWNGTYLQFGATIGGTEGPKGGKAAGRLPGAGKPLSISIKVPEHMPEHVKSVVDSVCHSVVADLPKILDAALPARQLFDQTRAFMGRYFWIEDPLSEVDHHERQVSAVWSKATGGLSDDSSLLTLFLSIAAGAPPKTLLSKKGAAALVRKIQKTGFEADLARQYILTHAPAPYQQDYTRLWSDFVDEAQYTLQSDSFSSLQDALALLRLECNVE